MLFQTIAALFIGIGLGMYFTYEAMKPVQYDPPKQPEEGGLALELSNRAEIINEQRIRIQEQARLNVALVKRLASARRLLLGVYHLKLACVKYRGAYDGLHMFSHCFQDRFEHKIQAFLKGGE